MQTDHLTQSQKMQTDSVCDFIYYHMLIFPWIQEADKNCGPSCFSPFFAIRQKALDDLISVMCLPHLDLTQEAGLAGLPPSVGSKAPLAEFGRKPDLFRDVFSLVLSHVCGQF